MYSEKDPQNFGRIGSLVAACGAVFEVIRSFVFGHDFVGWGLAIPRLVSVIVIACLAVSAVGLGIHRRFGWGVGVFAGVFSMGYGFMITAGGPGRTHAMWGTVFVVIGAALLGCLAKSLPYYRVVRSAHA